MKKRFNSGPKKAFKVFGQFNFTRGVLRGRFECQTSPNAPCRRTAMCPMTATRHTHDADGTQSRAPPSVRLSGSPNRASVVPLPAPVGRCFPGFHLPQCPSFPLFLSSFRPFGSLHIYVPHKFLACPCNLFLKYKYLLFGLCFPSIVATFFPHSVKVTCPLVCYSLP